MEKLKEVMCELDQMDPREWLNIPKPVVQGVLVLKSCTRLQSLFLEQLDRHYSDFEGRCNARILNVQKAVSENSEKSKEIEEGFKSALKFSELRINEKVDDFMRKVTENIFSLQCAVDEKISEVKEGIHDCNKRIDLMPTNQQVQGIVMNAGEKLKEKVLIDVKEVIVAPEIANLNQRIRLQHVAIDSAAQAFSAEKEEQKESNQRMLDNFIALQGTMNAFKHEETQRAQIFQENFENILKKLQELSGIRNEIENQGKQSMNMLHDYKKVQTQQIKKFESGLQNCEENINTMKHNLTQLAKPKIPKKKRQLSPPTPVPSPPPPPQIQILEIPWDEINEKIHSARLEILEKISEEKQKTAELIQSKIKKVEIQGEKNKDISTNAIQELQDKLNWLPISLNQLEGMEPGEARLFTIEARLRSEENSRIQAFNQLLCLIEALSVQREEEKFRAPSVERVLNIKSSDRKKTPQPGVNSDSYRKPESDRKGFSDAGSLIAGRFKFSTPVPDIDENRDKLIACKEKRKNGAAPKSWDMEITQIPRIQTAFTAKNKLFRPGKTNIL